LSRAIDIADAVVAELNAGGEFSQLFVAERLYLPDFDQEELDTVRVPVLARGISHERASREASEDEVEIQVGIMKRVPPEDTDAMDSMMNLVEEVMDHMAGRILKQYGQAVWVRTTTDAIYNASLLATNRVFQSVLTLTYKMIY
jgi:hypothetical protein